METVRLLYPDWFITGIIGFLTLITIIVICFIFATIKFIQYIDAALKSDIPSILYIKDLDNNNIINVEEIEQVTQRYNINTKQYEIVYYIKSGHELKEEFTDSCACEERFNHIYNILNDLNC